MKPKQLILYIAGLKSCICELGWGFILIEIDGHERERERDPNLSIAMLFSHFILQYIFVPVYYSNNLPDFVISDLYKKLRPVSTH